MLRHPAVLERRWNIGAAISLHASDWREGRQPGVWEPFQAGWSQSKLAEALGVTSGAVSQWMRRVREGGGPEALRNRKAPGAKCRLSESNRLRLLELLRQGAEAHNFRGEIWTRKHGAVLIAREFGVRDRQGHVSKLLAELGWSSQIPERRASQRDEAAMWALERWPELRRGQ